MTQASIERLYKDVDFLTSLRPFRTFQYPASLAKVLAYMANELEAEGYKTREQKWIADGVEYSNLIASYKPDHSLRLIVGAHYDVCGEQPGADDNASAVAGLLETARMIARNQPDLPYGIDFVSYCLEEPPYFGTKSMGSYVHAKSIHETGDIIRGMICYEMIGYFSEEPNSQQFPIPELAALYPSVGNFIIVVGLAKYRDFTLEFHTHMAEDAAIDVQKILFPADIHLAGLSDHRNYWAFDIPALMINDTSFLRNPHYHEVTDTIDTLNFEKMKAVVDASYKGIIGLSV